MNKLIIQVLIIGWMYLNLLRHWAFTRSGGIKQSMRFHGWKGRLVRGRTAPLQWPESPPRTSWWQVRSWLLWRPCSCSRNRRAPTRTLPLLQCTKVLRGRKGQAADYSPQAPILRWVRVREGVRLAVPAPLRASTSLATHGTTTKTPYLQNRSAGGAASVESCQWIA